MPLDSIYCVGRLIQTINVGQVTLPGESAIHIVPANPNRRSLKIVWDSGTTGNQYFGTSSSVNTDNGFPYVPGHNGVMELNWQSAIYGFQEGTGNSSTFAYIEEIWS